MALSIAGSDPSGGAGIQADLKIFSRLGVYAGAAITSLTAQNTTGVASVLPVDAEFVGRQISLVLEDMPVSHIKIGMVCTAAIAIRIGLELKKFSGEIICDPVLVSSSGYPLFELDHLDVFKRELCARATVLTPNLGELALLSGRDLSGVKEEIAAGREIIGQFPQMRALIIKGGHRAGEEVLTDHVLVRTPAATIEHVSVGHPRLASTNTHGTGCTFASAFTAFHLLSGDYVTSFRKTVALMDALIRKSAPFCLGRGNGPLLHHLG